MSQPQHGQARMVQAFNSLLAMLPLCSSCAVSTQHLQEKRFSTQDVLSHPWMQQTLLPDQQRAWEELQQQQQEITQNIALKSDAYKVCMVCVGRAEQGRVCAGSCGACLLCFSRVAADVTAFVCARHCGHTQALQASCTYLTLSLTWPPCHLSCVVVAAVVTLSLKRCGCVSRPCMPCLRLLASPLAAHPSCHSPAVLSAHSRAWQAATPVRRQRRQQQWRRWMQSAARQVLPPALRLSAPVQRPALHQPPRLQLSQRHQHQQA